jgi:hypothetical protein
VNVLYSTLKIKELELKVQWARGPNKRITVGSKESGLFTKRHFEIN